MAWEQLGWAALLLPTVLQASWCASSSSCGNQSRSALHISHLPALHISHLSLPLDNTFLMAEAGPGLKRFQILFMLLLLISLAKASLHTHGQSQWTGNNYTSYGEVEGTAKSHGKVVLWFKYLCPPSSNSYVEALTLNVMALKFRPLEGNQIQMRS